MVPGQVWEYSSEMQTNPTGSASGRYRVLRGGSGWSGARYCRVSFRRPWQPVRLLRPPPRFVPLVFLPGIPSCPLSSKAAGRSGPPSTACRRWKLWHRLPSYLFGLFAIFDYLNIYDINSTNTVSDSLWRRFQNRLSLPYAIS